MTKNITSRHVGHIEDGSFLLQNKAGRTIHCCDTGNGGLTAYQLLEDGAEGGDMIDHGYAESHAQAAKIAEALLTGKERPAALYDHVNAFLKATQGKIRRPTTLFDGLELSIQASTGHYCNPKSDQGPYTSVEIAAFTTGDEQEVRKELSAILGDPSDDFHVGLWGFLSVAKLNQEIERRGGITSHQLVLK